MHDYDNYNTGYDAMKYLGNHSTEDANKFRKIANSKAAQIFGELDRKDGIEDGKVSAHNWNEYARANFGNEISEGTEIGIMDGINSITTYEVRKAQELEKLQGATVKDFVAYDKDGKAMPDVGVRPTSHGFILYGKYGSIVPLER